MQPPGAPKSSTSAERNPLQESSPTAPMTTAPAPSSAGVAPRAEVAELSTAAYPHIADDNPWSIFCLRTRAGMRKHGIGQQLLTGAINFAFDNGATVIEGYPLDTDDKVAPIFAYPGFRRMFEREGFVKVADTTSVLDGVPRILMRLTHQDR